MSMVTKFFDPVTVLRPTARHADPPTLGAIEDQIEEALQTSIASVTGPTAGRA